MGLGEWPDVANIFSVHQKKKKKKKIEKKKVRGFISWKGSALKISAYGKKKKSKKKLL
jgi:hypothetical protein